MLKRAWTHLSEIFKKPAPPARTIGVRDILFFFRFVKPVWALGLLGLILTLFATFLGSLTPLSGKVFIDFIILQEGFEYVEKILRVLCLTALSDTVKRVLGSINLVVLLMLIYGLIVGILNILRSLLMVRFQQEITFSVQTQLFDRVVRFPLSLLREKQVGYLISRVSGDVGILQYFFSGVIPQFLNNSLYFIFSFGILFSLNRLFALILIILIPVWGLINYFFASRMRAISYQSMERHAEFTQDMQEVLSGVEVIKTHTSERREIHKVSRRLRQVFRARIQAQLLSSLAGQSVQTVRFVAMLLIAWLSVRHIHQGHMSIGDLAAIMAYVRTLAGLASGMSHIILSLQEVFAAMERLLEMFSIIPEIGEESGPTPLRKPEQVHGTVRFEEVSFAYQDDLPVLKRINLIVSPGEIVSITGPSGAGKTTLLNLLIKFYLPQEGKIYLDERNLRELDTHWLREQIGFVSQDTFLFNDTIEHNIKYGQPSATLEEVIHAARQAEIHEDILRLPRGYQTMVGERGTRLSGGQRQRVAIARTFLKNPPILILDEPTSALDAETESSLKTSLKRLAHCRTTFLITHRLTLTDVADRIYRLDNGVLVKEGPIRQ